MWSRDQVNTKSDVYRVQHGVGDPSRQWIIPHVACPLPILSMEPWLQVNSWPVLSPFSIRSWLGTVLWRCKTCITLRMFYCFLPLKWRRALRDAFTPSCVPSLLPLTGGIQSKCSVVGGTTAWGQKQDSAVVPFSGGNLTVLEGQEVDWSKDQHSLAIKS